MQPGPPRRRRARPVAVAPIDALLPRTEDLAKGWLLALLEQAPLEHSAAIPAADLARDGPRVCDAVIRAVADDTDLRRLEVGGALERLVSGVGELAGAVDPAGASAAVDTLHAIVWSALRDELRGPDPELVSELAERLALVVELVRAAVLRRLDERGAAAGGHAPGVPIRAAAVAEPPRRWPPPEPSQDDAEPGALWIRALEDEIERAEHAGTPLSLLLAELEDAERVAAAEQPAEASATFSRFTHAVRTVARRQDIVVCESDTRAWIIARDTARGGAHALGARIVAAVGEQSPWRGAPLSASVGYAVLGAEGRTAEEMIEAAEEARFTATSQGIGITPAGPQGSSGPGDRPGA